MDEHSQEEIRVYSILQELDKPKYHEDELKEIFGFKSSQPLAATKLYKYIHLQKQDHPFRRFTILQGELVTGDDVKGRTPILRGKYKITANIDGVPFTYVEKENHDRNNTISERKRSTKQNIKQDIRTES
jgi:hypothetical protein